jgi:hypothetical protein
VLCFRQDPGFDLNPYSYSADKLLRIEKKFRQYCYAGAIGLAGLFLCLLLINGLQVWYSNITKNDASGASARALSVKQENARVRDRLASIKGLVSSRNSITRVLYEVGQLAQDSIWYSEMSLSTADGVNVVIIGHSLSEAAIARLLAGAEAIIGVRNARLEYTEKVASDQVSRLTHGRKSDVLYRYKMILAL